MFVTQSAYEFWSRLSHVMCKIFKKLLGIQQTFLINLNFIASNFGASVGKALVLVPFVFSDFMLIMIIFNMSHCFRILQNDWRSELPLFAELWQRFFLWPFREHELSRHRSASHISWCGLNHVLYRGTLGLLKPANSVNPCHFQRTVSKCTQRKRISPVYGRSENGRLKHRVYSVRSLNGCCWHSVVLLFQNYGRISGSKAPSPFLNHGLRTFIPSRLCIWDSFLLFVHHVDADDMPPLLFGQTR